MIDQLPAVEYEQIKFVNAGKREPRIGNSASEKVTNKASTHNPPFPKDIHSFGRGSWGKTFVTSPFLMLLRVFAMQNSPNARLNVEYAVSTLHLLPYCL